MSSATSSPVTVTVHDKATSSPVTVTVSGSLLYVVVSGALQAAVPAEVSGTSLVML